MTSPPPREGDWTGIHTCHDECPCHTGGEPVPDFVAERTAPRRYTEEQALAIIEAVARRRPLPEPPLPLED